uniref:Uncharacterized protein n=1 Tax=Cyprinodon variegatus TaxID=28743 RepID=A0A3Q2EDB3_CYPVA
MQGVNTSCFYRFLTMCQSGCSISFRTWQALVVTELTPAHQNREKSQRLSTTYTFTFTPSFRRSLPSAPLVFMRGFLCTMILCRLNISIY